MPHVARVLLLALLAVAAAAIAVAPAGVGTASAETPAAAGAPADTDCDDCTGARSEAHACDEACPASPAGVLTHATEMATPIRIAAAGRDTVDAVGHAATPAHGPPRAAGAG